MTVKDAPPPATGAVGTGGASRRVRKRSSNLPTKFRVVFAGPVGAGKTTAIRSLSDVDPVDTDVPISLGSDDRGDGEKTTTTVGLDYGVWKPTAQISVTLLGTPGQERFTDARTSVTMPNTRVVLWLRADRPDIARDAKRWLPKFSASPHRIVIAVTRLPDDDTSEAQKKLASTLKGFGIPTSRVHAADPRDRDSVMRVVATALDFPDEES